MKQRQTILIFILILMAVATFLTVHLVQQRQEIRKRATTPQEAVFNSRVLYVILNPVEGNKNMAEEFFGWLYGGKSVEEWENLQAEKNITSFKRLSNNTINYQIVKKINVSQFPKYTNGFQYDFETYRNWGCTTGDPQGNCERQKWLFDNVAWVKDNRICEIANENNVDEIWTISPPFIMTYESFMIGPSDSFYINGPAFNLPAECRKHYAVLDMVYDREGPFLHIYGHKIESNMRYLTQNWKSEDYQKHWENFSAVSRYSEPYGIDGEPYARAYCGNAHFPSNAVKHYDFANLTYKDSTCVDWKNFPNYTGQTQNLNCQSWGCNEPGWQEFWFASLPKSEGEIEIEDNSGKKFLFKKNWWYYLLYPENSINFVKNPPRPTVTSTSTPTPKSGDITGDGKVDEADYAVLMANFGKAGDRSKGDLTGDGKIDEADYAVLMANFGK